MLTMNVVYFRVWALQPSPVTMATVMSKSMLLSLEWASNTDRLVSFLHYVICHFFSNIIIKNKLNVGLISDLTWKQSRQCETV